MIRIKIARRVYHRATQDALVPYAEHVVQSMRSQSTYAALEAEVTMLDAALKDYAKSLTDAQTKSTSAVFAKNKAKIVLLERLDQVADAMEIMAKGDVQLLVNAGFSLQNNQRQRYSVENLAAPRITRAYSTGIKGELRIRLEDEQPKVVRSHGLEYSTDRGETWQNGQYNSYRNFVWRGLPHSQELWLRASALGKGETKSEWSQPVIAAVL